MNQVILKKRSKVNEYEKFKREQRRQTAIENSELQITRECFAVWREIQSWASEDHIAKLEAVLVEAAQEEFGSSTTVDFNREEMKITLTNSGGSVQIGG